MSFEVVVRADAEGPELVRLAIGMDVHRALVESARRVGAPAVSALWDDAADQVIRDWELPELIAGLEAILIDPELAVDAHELAIELRALAADAHMHARSLEFVAQ